MHRKLNKFIKRSVERTKEVIRLLIINTIKEKN